MVLKIQVWFPELWPTVAVMKTERNALSQSMSNMIGLTFSCGTTTYKLRIRTSDKKLCIEGMRQ